MNKDATLAFYYFWDSHDFRYWAKEGYIPAELLNPSRTVELYEYMFDNRTLLFSKLKLRTRISYEH